MRGRAVVYYTVYPLMRYYLSEDEVPRAEAGPRDRTVAILGATKEL